MTRLGVALLTLIATPVLAAEAGPMPAFPTQRGDAAIMVWVSRNTSLPTGKSVVISPDNFLVIVEDVVDPVTPTRRRARFRQEATSIDFVARTGGRSAEGELDVDCAAARTRLRSATLYSGSDLKGGQVGVQGSDFDWRAPFADTASALVLTEACGFGRPAQTAPSTAAVPRPPAAPAPRAAPEPPPAASAPPAPEPPLAARPATGPYTAQLGAFGSRVSAEAYWAEVLAAFPEAFAGRTVRVTSVRAGGQTLWRVGVPGFVEAEGRAVCASLEAAGRGCFVRAGD